MNRDLGDRTTVRVGDGAQLCVEAIGDRDDPALLLIGGATWSMDWWEEGLCRRLADRGRLVVRYDQRDTGRSTSYPPGAPGYTPADLVADAVAVLDALRDRPRPRRRPLDGRWHRPARGVRASRSGADADADVHEPDRPRDHGSAGHGPAAGGDVRGRGRRARLGRPRGRHRPHRRGRAPLRGTWQLRRAAPARDRRRGVRPQQRHRGGHGQPLHARRRRTGPLRARPAARTPDARRARDGRPACSRPRTAGRSRTRSRARG